jgi:peroxiredoxin
LLVVLSVPSACNVPPPKSEPTELLGQRLPPFQMATLSGKTVTSESFAGHPVALAFVRTECAECERTLAALQGTFKSNERTVAWAVFAPVNEAAVKKVAVKLKLEYPVVIDEGERLKRLFIVETQPTTIVLDTLGYVTWKGGASITEDELSRVVSAAEK